jgi:hypothetical protein
MKMSPTRAGELTGNASRDDADIRAGQSKLHPVILGQVSIDFL